MVRSYDIVMETDMLTSARAQYIFVNMFTGKFDMSCVQSDL